MSERSIILPSGAEIVIRGMKISEANKLASRTTDEKPVQNNTSGVQTGPATSAPHVFNDLLRMCTVSVADPGPCYSDTSLNGFWDKALVADRFHALIQIRCTTYPDALYTFKYQCEHPDAGGCGQAFWVALNLEKGGDLKYVDVPAESRRTFRDGNRFHCLVAGKTVTFTLTIGADEARASSYIKKYPECPVSAALSSRIVEIEGVEPLDHITWLNDLDLGDFMVLRDVMEKVDGGIDTTLELKCHHCGHINFDVALPFGRQFLMPASSRR